MQIKELDIHNYRNLDDKKVHFADDCNFIVGENNLGKSNLLYLLNVLFSNRSFKESDFSEITKPIEVTIKLKLQDVEIGHFEDLFDSPDYHIINIVCKQLTPNDNIDFSHLETNTFIHASIIRCVNYIYYDSIRSPLSEINFDKGRGVGRFLSGLIVRYLEDKNLSDNDFVNEEKVRELLDDINSKISKVKAFSDFGIMASSDNDVNNILNKLVVLKDQKGEPLNTSGYGVQFLIMIVLSILEKIQSIIDLKRDLGIFEHQTDHTKFISLVIGLDEPEIHLHPYMQRSLVKYLNNIISNKNSDFQLLVKGFFGIDGFNGQIIVATHSPNIILNDYSQIVRLYPHGGLTKIKSGTEIVLEEKLSKRLHMHFPYIKEAFFSRCVIFVEGDSEESSFIHFSEKMGVDFDELGISVIQSRGGEVDAIKLLIDLVGRFDIPSVGIGDKDNKSPVSPPLYLTTKKDFEEELVSLIDIGRENFLNNLVCTYEDENAVAQIGSLNKYAVKAYGLFSDNFTSELRLKDIDKTDLPKLRAFYLTWLSVNKSFPLGKFIGQTILEEDIPEIYKVVIRKAVELSKQ